MRKAFTVLAAVCLAVFPGITLSAETLDSLTTVWRGVEKDLRSLVIEVEFDRQDPFLSREKSRATVKVLRTRDGVMMASCDVRREDQQPKDGLLYRDGQAYSLDYRRKAALIVATNWQDAASRFENSVFPCLVLLDEQRSFSEWEIEPLRDKELHTIVSIRRKSPRLSGWFPDRFVSADIAVLKEPTLTIPEGIPEFFRLRGPNDETRIRIVSWQFNGDVPPDHDDFLKPEDRAGWTVSSLCELSGDGR